MMKEYAKANKASDMAVETNKKKEDFGACVLFQIVCVSVLSPACPATRWAAPPPADGTQRAVCHHYVCACLFLCRAAFSSPHPGMTDSGVCCRLAGPILAAAIPQNRDLALKDGKKDEAIENLLAVSQLIGWQSSRAPALIASLVACARTASPYVVGFAD